MKKKIKKGDLVLLATIDGIECICDAPLVSKIGTFLSYEMSNPSIGQLKYETEIDVDSNATISDSLGNKFYRPLSGYTLVISVDLVGGRPPIKHYP